MHDDHGPCRAPISLPIAPTKNLYARLHLDQSGFDRSQGELASKEKTCHRLHVATP